MTPPDGAPLRQTLPARLFWRVYLNGLLLLVLVAVAVGAVGAALGRGPLGHAPSRFAEYVALRAADLRGQPQELARELEQVHDGLGAEVTIYDGGDVAASNVEPPLDPLLPDEAARLARGAFVASHRPPTFAAPVAGAPGTYVLVRHRFPRPTLVRGAALLGAVLLALALASIPLARAISAPLERLRRAVRAFGAGDMSARARLSERGEVGEVAEAFDQMAEQVENLVRGEKELLANVSHELRTPLARIRVALDLAAEGDLERSRRFLGEIGADLEELTRLVDDVLTAARLDLAGGRHRGGAVPLRVERVDARDLVARAAERFRANHPDRPLSVETSDELPILDADPALLRRVLDNLLDNARKYSDQGVPIALSASAHDGALHVEVRDRGIGMDREDLARVFTPFFRSDASRARDTGGVGLGLALARRIVEAHGGSIDLESRPGEGTCARFSVPGRTAS